MRAVLIIALAALIVFIAGGRRDRLAVAESQRRANPLYQKYAT